MTPDEADRKVWEWESILRDDVAFAAARPEADGAQRLAHETLSHLIAATAERMRLA